MVQSPSAVVSNASAVVSFIDLSHNNPELIDWQAVLGDNVHAVIHKASEGLHYIDRYYSSRRKQTLAIANLLWGAYHFLDNCDGVTQAKLFLSVVFGVSLADVVNAPNSSLTPNIHLVMDFEQRFDISGNDISPTHQQAVDFASYIMNKTGCPITWYSGISFAQQICNANPSSPLAYYCNRMWGAEYPGANGPTNISQIKTPSFYVNTGLYAWQHTGGRSGLQPWRTAGVNGPCDRSIFNGTLTQMQTNWISAPSS